jgi:hypothetical protein
VSQFFRVSLLSFGEPPRGYSNTRANVPAVCIVCIGFFFEREQNPGETYPR